MDLMSLYWVSIIILKYYMKHHSTFSILSYYKHFWCASRYGLWANSIDEFKPPPWCLAFLINTAIKGTSAHTNCPGCKCTSKRHFCRVCAPPTRPGAPAGGTQRPIRADISMRQCRSSRVASARIYCTAVSCVCIIRKQHIMRCMHAIIDTCAPV